MNSTTRRCRQFLVAVALLFPAAGLRAENAAVQNAPVELSFTVSREQVWRDFPIQVIFTHQESRVELDAFWDGGREWKVRFAPPAAGDWRYEVRSQDPAIAGKSGVLRATAPDAEALRGNPNLRGQVRAASGARHFAYADGTPVLLLGDCLLMSGLEFGDFTRLLDHRRAAGFNALNVRLCKMGAKNEGGEVFADKKVDGLNPRHFQALDRRMQAAWERGFVTFFMPDFLGFGSYTEADARDLWRYLLARYSAFNVCAIVTGEYDNPRRVVKEWKPFARWNALGDFVRAMNERGHRVPLGTHPVNSSSGAAFHGQAWLDYNQIQAKVWDQFDTTPMSVLEDWARTPPKPTFYAEGTYENQPWAGITGGPLHIRHQTWVALLCGAAAVDYGEHRLKGGELKGTPVKALLDMPGAQQAARAVNFLRGLDWWNMSPQPDAVLLDGKAPPLRERKARTTRAYSLAEPGKRHVVYLMAGLENRTLTLTALGETRFTARWLDPRTGQFTAISQSATGDWPLPARPAPADADWVLVLEKGFQP